MTAVRVLEDRPDGGRPAAATRPVSAVAGPEGPPILVIVPTGAWTASLDFDGGSQASDGRRSWPGPLR